jgi:hypothetical protein
MSTRLDKLSEEQKIKLTSRNIKRFINKKGEIVEYSQNYENPPRYCFLRDNQILQKVVYDRKKEMGCRWIDITFNAYNGRNRLEMLNYVKRNSRRISQYKLLKVLEFMGIEVELKITIKDEWKKIEPYLSSKIPSPK